MKSFFFVYLQIHQTLCPVAVRHPSDSCPGLGQQVAPLGAFFGALRVLPVAPRPDLPRYVLSPDSPAVRPQGPLTDAQRSRWRARIASHWRWSEVGSYF